ncbi:MAG TPA: hypothetical protein VLU41_11760, partial [Ideonella sp.]|nr:hypothetical protein [Ideonella sp.]
MPADASSGEAICSACIGSTPAGACTDSACIDSAGISAAGVGSASTGLRRRRFGSAVSPDSGAVAAAAVARSR